MNVEIIAFNDALEAHFSALNIAWLKKYFEVEPLDNEMLFDPKQFIIEKGGFIFFAKIDKDIVGTFALIKIEDGIFELSKMAVDESFRGKKIGNNMLKFCLEEAERLNAQKVILYSNTRLEPAIHLYKKFGFREVPFEDSDYKRANIKMEINIKEP